MTDPDFVVVGVEEYNALKRDSMVLAALYAGGVDNWEWYDESLRDLNLDGDE
jgi:hypothetical protein